MRCRSRRASSFEFRATRRRSRAAFSASVRRAVNDCTARRFRRRPRHLIRRPYVLCPIRLLDLLTKVTTKVVDQPVAFRLSFLAGAGGPRHRSSYSGDECTEVIGHWEPLGLSLLPQVRRQCCAASFSSPDDRAPLDCIQFTTEIGVGRVESAFTPYPLRIGLAAQRVSRRL